MDVLKIVENIQRICKERGTTPTVAGKESGAGKDLVSAMKRRGVLPSIEKMRLLADYLGVTTSELLGEELPGAAPAGKADLQAAFWGGEKDLSQEDLDAMWDDVERFAQFLAEKKRQEKQNND